MSLRREMASPNSLEQAGRGIRRILLPTRFLDLSRAAAPYALDLAARYGAELHVLHAVRVPEPDLVASMVVAGDISPFEELERTRHAEAEAEMARFIGEVVGAAKVPVIASVRSGAAPGVLSRYSKESSIDLVVMGTHADSLLGRLVFGSVSKSLLESVGCPVMLVPVFRRRKPSEYED